VSPHISRKSKSKTATSNSRRKTSRYLSSYTLRYRIHFTVHKAAMTFTDTIPPYTTTAILPKDMNTAMLLEDFSNRRITMMKNPVTPLPIDVDEKSSPGSAVHHDLPHLTCLSPPPPPQRRYDDPERNAVYSGSNNDLLVLPSLSGCNLKRGGAAFSSSHVPTFKLQPKRGGLPSLHEGYFK
jgi:hypothetical protein